MIVGLGVVVALILQYTALCTEQGWLVHSLDDGSFWFPPQKSSALCWLPDGTVRLDLCESPVHVLTCEVLDAVPGP